MNIQVTEILTDPPSAPARCFRVIIDQPNDPVNSREIIRMVTATCFNGQAAVCSRKAVELIPGVWEVIYDWGTSPAKPQCARVYGPTLSEVAVQWCIDANVRTSPSNIVTALHTLGALRVTNA